MEGRSVNRAGLIFAGAVVTASVLSIGVYAMKYEVERLDDRGGRQVGDREERA